MRVPMRVSASLAAWMAAAVVLGTTAMPAQAELYKCRTRDGRVEFTDQKCPGATSAEPFRPRRELTVIESERFTGKPRTAAPGRPSWLKPLDPVGDCKAKGGRIDPELRACIVP